MSKSFKQFLFVVVLALAVGFWFQSSSVAIFAQTQTTLNQKQAVEIAEKFVAANGYTEKPVSRTSNLYLEEGENASDLKNILAARSNSIESRAVFALVQGVDGQSFWVVRFLFIDEKTEGDFDLGREVRVSLDGRKVWLNPKPVVVQETRRFGDCTGEGEKPSETF